MDSETNRAPILQNRHNTVSQQAFSVYCDYVALDAAARNEQLLEESESLGAPKRTVFNVQITQNLEVLKNFNMCQVMCSMEEGGHHFVYAFDDIDAFPHEEIGGLNLTISGVTVPTRFRRPPSLTISDDGIVEVEIKFFNEVSVVGILENFSGTMEQVKDMIRSNDASRYFGFLVGAVDAETGQPIDHDGTAYTNYLEGSTFLIKSIKIHSEAVVPTVEGFMRYDASTQLAETEEDDLQNLSKASITHYGLRNAAEDHKALTEYTHFQKFFWDTLNCVAVHWREDSFVCHLEDSGRQRLNPVNGVPEWVCEPPEGVATIPISSLRTIRICFAGMHWDADRPILLTPTPQRALIFEFSPAITAILVPDESWNELNFEDSDVLEYIRHGLTPPGSNLISNYQGPEPELTMRLVWLSIELSNLYTIMNALGVDCTSAEDD